MEISRETFDQQRRPRFGSSNPERMRLEFWEWMIRGESNPAGDEGSLHKAGLIMREGKLKSSYGPYRARDLFGLPLRREDGPIWTFDRMGATRTNLPDGRLICIGGEHEDFYDADFCIYNDVVVFEQDGQIEIFGYPKEIFPPTDFHTASVAGHRIIIVGGLGYAETRHPGCTPVYVLEPSTYRILRLETWGEKPGWIFRHTADRDRRGIITIRGGEVFEEHDGQKRYRGNFEDYSLNVKSCEWKRLTYRNWQQFFICQKDGSLFVLERHPTPEALVPREFTDLLAGGERDQATFVVEGVPVSLTVTATRIEMVVQGEVPEERALRIAEQVRFNTEAAIQETCILEQV